MSYIIKLFIISLFGFVNYQFVRGFNETCGDSQPPCPEPLKCFGGYCLCSPQSTTTTPGNNISSFWNGEQCTPCPNDYVNTAVKCYKLIVGKENQMDWTRARTRCQQDGADLFVIRSLTEYNMIMDSIQANIKEDQMFQRTPQNASSFASIWIGVRLLDWNGVGEYSLVSHGPTITKTSYYWCSASSPIGQEPTYVGIKSTGEREECIALAAFPDNAVCMHSWFCSWDSYVLCEVHPPPIIPNTTSANLQALEEETDDTQMYMIIGGIILLVLVSIGIFCFVCKRKNSIARTESTDSAESGSSEN